MKVLAEVGNSVVNEVYEYNVPDTVIRASAKCLGYVFNYYYQSLINCIVVDITILYFSPIREQWIRNKYVDRLFVKPIPNNELVLEEYNTRKWSVRKVRRRGTQFTVKNEKKDNVMVIGGNTRSISLDVISSDDDSTISDDGTDG